MSALGNQLFGAVYGGDAQRCLDLLAGGADANAVGSYLLHTAATHGESRIASILIEHGARVNTADRIGWSPLHSAARFGRANACLILLEAGGDPLIKDNAGQTALDLATQYHHEACVNVIKPFIAANAARVALREMAGINALKSALP